MGVSGSFKWGAAKDGKTTINVDCKLEGGPGKRLKS